jgi:hypothetical protein
VNEVNESPAKLPPACHARHEASQGVTRGCRKPQKSPQRDHPCGLLSCRYPASLEGLFPLPRDLLVALRQFDPVPVVFAADAVVVPLPSAVDGLQFRLTNNVELFQRQPHEQLRLRVVEMAGATERVGPCLFGGDQTRFLGDAYCSVA